MTNTSDSPNRPGRLGTPGMDLKDDPRADPRMVAAMAPFGLDVAPPPAPVTIDSSLDELLPFCDAAEEGYGALFGAFFGDLPAIANVTSSTEVITGVDGNEINLYVHRPTDVDGPMPAIVHTHGGGMVLGKASDPNYVRWRDELAATGMVVVGVEFRNGGGALGPHPFPAGLNDCASGLRWTHENREALGISKIVISGESGGGNLCTATAMLAKQDGYLDIVDGVYAQCPYISGMYSKMPDELASLTENDNYFLSCSMMGALVKVYDPELMNMTNPLAWPYHASTEELSGLPPFVVSVNELDPLRDEGLALHRKLLAAGVSSVSRTVNGTCHAGDCLFIKAMPDVCAATIGDIKRFADSL